MILDARRKSNRSGFTLLEVILASAISVVLLGALYVALNTQLRISRTGPEIVQRTQLARGVLNRFTRDIQAMIAPDEESSGSPSATSATGDATTTEADEEEEILDGFAAGMVGGPDWIQIYLRSYRANLDDLEIAAQSGMVGHASNVRRVTYSIEPISQDISQGTLRLGVARSEVAAILAGLADTGTGVTQQRSITDFIAADVANLEFLYWDETLQDWTDTWGLDTPIAPPRAIKILVSFQSQEQYAASSSGYTTMSTYDPVYEHIVHVPVFDDSSVLESLATDSTL